MEGVGRGVLGGRGGDRRSWSDPRNDDDNEGDDDGEEGDGRGNGREDTEDEEANDSSEAVVDEGVGVDGSDGGGGG